MITHVVMMKFNPSVTDADVAQLEKLLGGLPDVISEIQSYDFGRDVLRSDRSYDFALVSVFANLETLSFYQQHPAHRVVVKKLGAMCAHIAVVDYQNEPYHQRSEATAPEEDPWQRKDLFRPA